MSKPVPPSRQNRTITVDFNNEQTYHQLCGDGKGFIDFVVAFILSIGLQLKHKCGCSSGRLTRHSHYVRARINGITIWQVQCTGCRAVFTVLPHFVLRRKKNEGRDRQESASRHAWRVESRALCRHRKRLSDGNLPFGLFSGTYLPGETPDTLSSYPSISSLTKSTATVWTFVYLPTIGCGRVIWHLGYTTAKSVDAFAADYGEFRQAAIDIDSSYQVAGILTDGFDSTRKSLSQLFPFAKLANCMLHVS